MYGVILYGDEEMYRDETVPNGAEFKNKLMGVMVYF
jgi:hypothetical protein